MGNSFALIADAIESTTDIFSSGIVLLGVRYAKKPPDKNHPYGHGKAEALITFLTVGFLVASATVIVVEAIKNIQHPHPSPKPFVLIILAVIIAIKELTYRLFRSADTSSTLVNAEAWHHRSDAITSIAAFLGISIAIACGPRFAAADDWAALLAAGVILYNSYLLFRPALGEVMDEHHYDDLVNDIRVVARQVDGIHRIETCHVRKAGTYFYIDLHAEVDGQLSVETGHKLAHQLKDALRSSISSIRDVLIHIEPIKSENRDTPITGHSSENLKHDGDFQ